MTRVTITVTIQEDYEYTYGDRKETRKQDVQLLDMKIESANPSHVAKKIAEVVNTFIPEPTPE